MKCYITPSDYGLPALVTAPRWIATQVEDHWHQAVVIKTPCGSRLPMAKWSKIADSSVVAQYERVAWSQLKVRCPWCDETKLCMDVPTERCVTHARTTCPPVLA